MTITSDRMSRFSYQQDDQVEVIDAGDDDALVGLGISPIPQDFEAATPGAVGPDDLADVERDLDALSAEIVAEWEADSRGDDMGHGYNPNRAGNGQFGSGPHHDRKAAQAERAQGHVDRAAGHLSAIAAKHQASEAQHATSKATAAASMKQSKAAKALAKKDPTAENVAAWHSSTKQAIRDRATAAKHGDLAQRHADLHDKAETTHAIAQAKLKEAQRAAPAPVAAARELHGIGFDRVHGEHEGTEAAPSHVPIGERQHVSESAATAHARTKGGEIDSEVAARAHAAEATRVAQEAAASRGTTSTYQPTSVAQEVAQREARGKASGTRSDPRKSGESWYDYDVRSGKERQERVSKAHATAQADRDRYVVPPGSIPFPEKRGELPRAIALPKAAETVGLPPPPGKKRRRDEAENARALVAVAKEYPTEASIAAAREAVELARLSGQDDE